MICHSDYSIYTVLGETVNLFTQELDRTTITYGEIDSYIICVGEEPDNVMSAIFAFQDSYNYQLSELEIAQVLEDNDSLEREYLDVKD